MRYCLVEYCLVRFWKTVFYFVLGKIDFFFDKIFSVIVFVINRGDFIDRRLLIVGLYLVTYMFILFSVKE